MSPIKIFPTLSKGQSLALVVMPVMTVGCATTLIPYSEPPVEPTATLTIRTGKTDITNGWVIRFLGNLDHHRCSAQPAEVVAILNNRSVFSKFADKGASVNEVTVRIPANGDRFRFFIPYASVALTGSEVVTTTCRAHVSFVPEKGKKYTATYSPFTSACDIPIREVTDAGNVKPVEWKRHPPCQDDLGRNFSRESFVLDYYSKHRNEYED